MILSPLPEGSVIGVLGGGQLGRMIIEAASQLGYQAHVFAPDGDSPATDIAAKTTRANYDDEPAIRHFAENVDSVVCEFENVPAQTMDMIADLVPVSPGGRALATAQHRLAEKNLARKLEISTPRYAAVSDVDTLCAALNTFGSGILKTCRFGYDGKGQVRLEKDADAAAALAALKSDDLILEEVVSFTAEVSFMIARARNGEIAVWPATINLHRDGILHISEAPADDTVLPPHLAAKGIAAVTALAESLDLVGVLAAEMFITTSGHLVFNEIAPRPHNSFHWTIEGSATSQFSQLVRIAANLPLGSTETRHRWRMTNILGQDMAELGDALNQGSVFVHRYGKAHVRPGRKMAHLTQRLD